MKRTDVRSDSAGTPTGLMPTSDAALTAPPALSSPAKAASLRVEPVEPTLLRIGPVGPVLPTEPALLRVGPGLREPHRRRPQQRIRGGVLSFKNPPDHEAKDTYTYDVTLQASDRKNDEGQAVQLSDPDIDAMFTVTVNVTDVNEAPSITTAPTDGEVSVDELYTGEVTRFEATDPETDGITWTLTGTDQDDVEIESDTGIVTLARTPDFEDPQDSNRNNSYVVTVEASDGKLEATQRLTVTVANVAEDGSVSFSSRQPQDGTPFTATLSDPDGRITGTTWTWERSSDKSNWTFIMRSPSGPSTAESTERSM